MKAMKLLIGIFLLLPHLGCQGQSGSTRVRDETDDWTQVCIDGRIFYKRLYTFNYYLPKIKKFGEPVYCDEEKQ